MVAHMTACQRGPPCCCPALPCTCVFENNKSANKVSSSFLPFQTCHKEARLPLHLSGGLNQKRKIKQVWFFSTESFILVFVKYTQGPGSFCLFTRASFCVFEVFCFF